MHLPCFEAEETATFMAMLSSTPPVVLSFGFDFPALWRLHEVVFVPIAAGIVRTLGHGLEPFRGLQGSILVGLRASSSAARMGMRSHLVEHVAPAVDFGLAVEF